MMKRFHTKILLQILCLNFRLGKEWDALEAYMMKHMSDVYYDATIDEWLATLVHPPKQEIKQLVKSGNKYLESCNR